MDEEGRVIGEARRYDPYSQFGHIMLYEMDSFGFIPGYIKKGLRLMSENDLMSDGKLKKSLELAKYETWKRRNISDLINEYNHVYRNHEFFDIFCRRIYENTLEKGEKKN